jgi:hypothetical protein
MKRRAFDGILFGRRASATWDSLARMLRPGNDEQALAAGDMDIAKGLFTDAVQVRYIDDSYTTPSNALHKLVGADTACQYHFTPEAHPRRRRRELDCVTVPSRDRHPTTEARREDYQPASHGVVPSDPGQTQTAPHSTAYIFP